MKCCAGTNSTSCDHEDHNYCLLLLRIVLLGQRPVKIISDLTHFLDSRRGTLLDLRLVDGLLKVPVVGPRLPRSIITNDDE